MNNGIYGISSQQGIVKSESTVIVKPINQPLKSANTTLAADPHLYYPLLAGKIYSGRFVLIVSASGTTTDLKLTIKPNGVSGYYHSISTFNGVAVASSPTALIPWGTNLTFGTINGITGIVLEFALISPMIANNTLELHWAQNTSSAQTLRLQAGSRLEIHETPSQF